MLCINNTCTDAYFNLAVEEYLLKNSSEDIFMLWQSEPVVVIGKHQDVWAEVDLEFVREHQIKVARRFSGGGAVYQDQGNLNLTFIENSNTVDFNKFTNFMLDLLAKVGIHAVADARRAITVDGLKISGSAQCIHQNKALFHATLLYSSDLFNLHTALQGDTNRQEKKEGVRKASYVKSVRSPVTNISKHLASPMSINVFKEMVLNYFLRLYPENQIYTFSEADITAIHQLRDEKYATSAWNFNPAI